MIELGHFDEARVHLQQVVELEPDHADANINLANVFVRLERYDEAIVQYKKALLLRPDHFGSHFILGIALHDQGQHAEAEHHFRQAILLNPGYADTHNSLGLALMGQGRVDEAAASYHEAVRLKPDYLAAHINLGTALEKQEKLEEAIACYEQALRLDHGWPAACNNLGMVLKRQGKLAAAMARFEQTIALEPGYGAAHWNRAAVWLLQGDFDAAGRSTNGAGLNRISASAISFSRPGTARRCAGRPFCCYAEQGIGDTFQFVRYVRLVKERGGRMVFQCQPSLFKLLGNLPEIDSLVLKNSPMSAFDVHAALLSLPAIFGTSVATVPAAVPYLYARPDLVEKWRKELEAMSGVPAPGSDVTKGRFDTGHRTPGTGRSFKIGLAWQGNPEFRDDRDRSVPLRSFAPLARVPGVQLISLQKGPGTDQLRDLGGKFAVLDLADRLDEEAGPFMDTAALIKNLDLVICSDTAVPHLAGALGVPVWVALSMVPDWRWLLDRDDSPWYPTMRLFRQKRKGHWDDIFKRMAEELKTLSL